MENEKINSNESLEALSIAELRKIAGHFNVVLTRDMTKQDIIHAIRTKHRGKDIAEIAMGSDAPKPGWSRIIVHRDGHPGASNRPVYVAVNGYKITIPRGVEVDVPTKIVKVLNDAKQRTLKENTSVPPNDPKRFTWEESHSYPFSCLMTTPGEDPRPGNEASRTRRDGPRMRFWEKKGYWPKPEELRNWMQQGEK